MSRLLMALVLGLVSMTCMAQIVTVPIPGAPGLSVTVGTGANALPLRDIRSTQGAVNITQGDDSYQQVPLGFTFPFFGQNFTNSWPMTNGVVTFQDPGISGAWGLCCEGVDLTKTKDTRYNYAIYPLHTDLYSWNGQNQWYLRENNTMTYGWYNLSQCCSSQGGNSFEVKINSAGLVDVRLSGAMVSYNAVTSGMAGDLAKGEYFQYYHGSGISIPAGSAGIFSWQALSGTGAADPCITNPLSSPTCPGYQQAYLTQQCTISALYDPTCPGYQQAYFTYQCSINPLYSELCPGYQQAYYNQQCSLNPLYDSGCTGYAQAYYTQQCTANPLYDSGCAGYKQAYYEQQCSLNPLYDSGCTGYQQAYFNQQCGLNPLWNAQCPGYGSAYFTQQCSLNPLYNAQCSGYSQAYFTQQCGLNALYNSACPGYQQAYYDQQCRLNGLYDRGCPNYATAYATQQLLSKTTVAPTTNTTVVTASNAATPAVGDAATVAVIAEPAAAAVVNNTTQSTAPSASPAAVTTAVPLVSAAPAASSPASPVTTATVSSSSGTTAPAPAASNNSPQPTTRAQQIQQARQEAQRRAQAAQADSAQAAAREARSMEQQVASQNSVITAMGYNAAFAAYENQVLRDVQFYQPRSIYQGQTTVDNRRALWGLTGASDRRWEQMRDQQYQQGARP